MLSTCNPLAGIQVFHTELVKRKCISLLHRRCNPLAGIQVFHTRVQRGCSSGAGGCSVVIPWRGFRCFTLAQNNNRKMYVL